MELESYKDKIKENQEKIKLNKQLPYLVGNIVEVPILFVSLFWILYWDFWTFNSESSGMDGKKLFLDFSTFFFDYDVIIFCI